MMGFLKDVLILSVVIFGVAQFLPGVRVKDFQTSLLVALVYSVLHFLLFKILFIIAFPVVVLTFFLFVFVINAFLLWLTDQFIDDFKIDSLGTTVFAALIITVGSKFLHWIF